MRPTIYIDTREKQPYSFKGAKEIRKALKVGDYSVQGGLGKNGIIIERKTAEDLVNTLTNKDNLRRFKKELKGMNKFGFKAVVVESSIKGFASTVSFSRTSANPFKVFELFMELCMEHKVSPLFCGNRKTAEYTTHVLLVQFLNKNIQNKWLV